MSQGVHVDGGRELELLRQTQPLVGSLLTRVLDAIRHTANYAGVGSMGQLSPPEPIDAISVQGQMDDSTNVLTVSGEVLHYVCTHNAEVNRGIQYVAEIDTDPSFANAHPLDNGSSRSGFSRLPANDASGTPVTYYLRVTPQMQGSDPGKPTVFGTKIGPTGIRLLGSTNMSLLTSQSGGTARPGQTGKGLGPVRARGSVGGPKRNFST